MTGPSPTGKGLGARIRPEHYAPSVYAWLKAGRPDGGIPSGALIIKQMYNDNNGQPGAINGWTIIVKKKGRLPRRLVLGATWIRRNRTAVTDSTAVSFMTRTAWAATHPPVRAS